MVPSFLALMRIAIVLEFSPIPPSGLPFKDAVLSAAPGPTRWGGFPSLIMTLYVFCPDQFTTATHLHSVELCSKLQRLRSSFLQMSFFQNLKSFICLPSTVLFQAQSALPFLCPQFRIAGRSVNTDCWCLADPLWLLDFHKSRQPPRKSHSLLAATEYFRILGCQSLLLSSDCTDMEAIQWAGKGERAPLKRGLRAGVRRQEANQSGGLLEVVFSPNYQGGRLIHQR